MKGFYGFWHRILAGPFRFLFRVHVEGRENEPGPEDGPYLVCANHTTAGDPVWLCASLRRQQPHFMSKAELFKIPLLGGLLRRLGAYPVERGSADLSSLRNTIGLLHDGKCVGMFPQGTRMPGVDPATTRVKSGVGIIAVRGGVQVLPVYIQSKKFCAKAFRRKRVIIGKPISYETIAAMHADHVEYSRIAEYIFGQVCALSGEAEVSHEQGK